MLKNIVHVIKHVNFQLYRVYPAGFIWKNQQMKANINKQIEAFIHQVMCLSKYVSVKIKKRQLHVSQIHF